MYKFLLLLLIIICNLEIVNANGVSFGLRGGVISQTFPEEQGTELWPAMGGLVEFAIPNSALAVRIDIGAGIYQKEETGVKIAKTDVQLEAAGKYIWKIASSETAVYGDEAPYRMGISNGLAIAMHLYNVEKQYPDSVVKTPETGIGLHLFGGVEYLISSYILFAEIGWGTILRGDFFQEKQHWTQLAFMVGARF